MADRWQHRGGEEKQRWLETGIVDMYVKKGSKGGTLGRLVKVMSCWGSLQSSEAFGGLVVLVVLPRFPGAGHQRDEAAAGQVILPKLSLKENHEWFVETNDGTRRIGLRPLSFENNKEQYESNLKFSSQWKYDNKWKCLKSTSSAVLADW